MMINGEDLGEKHQVLISAVRSIQHAKGESHEVTTTDVREATDMSNQMVLYYANGLEDADLLRTWTPSKDEVETNIIPATRLELTHEGARILDEYDFVSDDFFNRFRRVESTVQQLETMDGLSVIRDSRDRLDGYEGWLESHNHSIDDNEQQIDSIEDTVQKLRSDIEAQQKRNAELTTEVESLREDLDETRDYQKVIWDAAGDLINSVNKIASSSVVKRVTGDIPRVKHLQDRF
jgi:FtsZ-binding cell division protein ZapB